MLTVVAFGDSLTAGSALGPGQKNWTECLAQRLSIRVVNRGIGGNTIAQGWERMENDVVSNSPEIVLICFGMNDHVICDAEGNTQTEENEFTAILERMIDRVREIGAIPVLITPNAVIEEYYYTRHPKEWYSKTGGGNMQLNRYCNRIRAVAENRSVPLVDLFAESSRQNLCKLVRTPQNGNFADGVHPYGDGILFYTEHILYALQKVLP